MKKIIMILGATGMIGNGLFKKLSEYKHLDVYGTMRGQSNMEKIISNVDIFNFDIIMHAISLVKPDIIINCTGIIKQNLATNDYLSAITINAQFPHRLSLLADTLKAKVIQISTDCVFDGLKGNYLEEENPNAQDIYGKTKALGEIKHSLHCLTLRTSVIGHELRGYVGLLEWFMQQKSEIKGFTEAYFSGFTVGELARIIAEYILPDSNLTGLYHLSSRPISKYDLLTIINDVYGKNIIITPSKEIYVDRTLNSQKFKDQFKYRAPAWKEMIAEMHTDYLNEPRYRKL